jgi:hypothetical protein
MNLIRRNLTLAALILVSIGSIVQPAMARPNSAHVSTHGNASRISARQARPTYDARGFFNGWDQPTQAQGDISATSQDGSGEVADDGFDPYYGDQPTFSSSFGRNGGLGHIEAGGTGDQLVFEGN